MLKKLPLWAKIFIGMGVGILWGLICVWVGWEAFTIDWIKPWGTIFLKLLKMIAVPLIFVSLVKGISSLTDITKLSRIGYKTIGIYLVTTVFATTVGLVMVNIVKPGVGVELGFTESVDGLVDKAGSVKDILYRLIPENIVDAMAQGTILSVIFPLLQTP